ncbi:hypothetical protein [Halococcus hamelinensis]|uniref:Uncharacterized protein n=1 Tax=Halococcus hamelinensis 100A6 TaxID=1132509 RepID=M0LY48_9EURY|nr:hypothetical protein [Halococcus hamelinensis]EMA38381.1 hypothetical protein C447_09502 [Halococcus hamelinensis 100A6]
MNPKRLRSQDSDSTGPTRTRLLLTGVLVCLVLLAGCGGNTDDGGTTVANTEAPVEETATSAPPTMETAGTSSTSPSTAGTSTVPANVSTNASGLEVTVDPTTENTTDVNLIAHATMTDATASEGIETITIETGGGLDLTNVSVANVDTAGIDENGSLVRDRTDESLASSVERDVQVADDGRRLRIALDGNTSVEPGDEIVAVLEGGVETGSAGSYTFGLAVDNATAQTDDYTITSS